MNRRPMDRVENYTVPFLWMFYLVLMIALVAVWGVWGYAFALLICAAIHYGISQLAHRLQD